MRKNCVKTFKNHKNLHLDFFGSKHQPLRDSHLAFHGLTLAGMAAIIKSILETMFMKFKIEVKQALAQSRLKLILAGPGRKRRLAIVQPKARAGPGLKSLRKAPRSLLSKS